MLLKSVANFLIRDLLLDKLECARIAGALAADQELFRSKALCGHFQKVPAGLGEWKVIKHINRHSSIEKKTRYQAAMDQYYTSKQHVHTWSYMRILTQHFLAYSSDHKLSMPCWHRIGECAILPTSTNASDRSPRAFFDTGLQGRKPWPQMTVQYFHFWWVWSSVLCNACFARSVFSTKLPCLYVPSRDLKHMKPNDIWFHVF